MKFTKARAKFYQSDDEAERRTALRKMAEVIAQAPANGFSEADVTQDAGVPDEVRYHLTEVGTEPEDAEEDYDDRSTLVQLSGTVDTTDLVEIGSGPEAVYAYG